MKGRVILLLLFFALICSPMFEPGVAGITDEEIFRQMRFNFINPGGRALGLGGSFIAVADDATAAQANPAGLAYLTAPELFAEVRFIGNDQNRGDQPAFQGVYDFSSQDNRRPVTTPTFLSYVYPLETMAFGFSRQELMNSRTAVANTIVDIQPDFGPTTWTGRGEVALQVTNWNLSYAWRPAKWVSLGATATFGRFHIDAETHNTISDPQGNFLCSNWDGGIGGVGPFDCSAGVPATLSNPQSWYSTRIDDDDTDFSYSAGALFEATPSLNVGIVYRGDSDYHFLESLTDGLSSSVILGGGPMPSTQNTGATASQRMHLPASYGIGLKWRPANRWTLAADGVRIRYSQLLDHLGTNLNLLTNLLNSNPISSGPSAQITIEDVTEIHVGSEYFNAGGKLPWAARFGAYTDPDNTLHATSEGVFGPALTGRDTEIHYTAGMGFVFQQKLEIDTAIAVSSLGNDCVVSLIYRH